MFVQESRDLSSQSRSVQKVAHGTGIVEQLSSQLSRQGIPLHDQCGAEAPQDELFFVREWRAD
jgi:predicted ATPase